MAHYVVLILATAMACFMTGCRPARTASHLRDRRQLTFTGNVTYPAISRDGKQLAYGVLRCAGGQCAYDIAIQDLLTNTNRGIAVHAPVLYSIRWSPDESALLFCGIAQEGWATYLVPASGGTARRVAPVYAAFSANGGALLSTPNSGTADEHFIDFTSMDGTRKRRIRAGGRTDWFQVETAVPGSPWIIVRSSIDGNTDELRAVDETGRFGGSITVQDLNAGYVTASRGAIWAQTGGRFQNDILRIPFDEKTGRFGGPPEKVYSGDRGGGPTIYSVTEDGNAI